MPAACARSSKPILRPAAGAAAPFGGAGDFSGAAGPGDALGQRKIVAPAPIRAAPTTQTHGVPAPAERLASIDLSRWKRGDIPAAPLRVEDARAVDPAPSRE